MIFLVSNTRVLAYTLCTDRGSDTQTKLSSYLELWTGPVDGTLALRETTPSRCTGLGGTARHRERERRRSDQLRPIPHPRDSPSILILQIQPCMQRVQDFSCLRNCRLPEPRTGSREECARSAAVTRRDTHTHTHSHTHTQTQTHTHTHTHTYTHTHTHTLTHNRVEKVCTCMSG